MECASGTSVFGNFRLKAEATCRVGCSFGLHAEATWRTRWGFSLHAEATWCGVWLPPSGGRCARLQAEDAPAFTTETHPHSALRRRATSDRQETPARRRRRSRCA